MGGFVNATEVHLLDCWQDPKARAFFRNVWPIYVHEIASFDTDFYRLGPDGRWLPDLVEDWIAPQTPVANLTQAPLSPARGPFQRSHVIVAGDQPVGFVCIGVPPFKYMPADVDVVLAELFIARPFRAKRIAEQAVEQLLSLYPGRWHLAAIRENLRALRFWRRTLRGLRVDDLSETIETREVRFWFSTSARSR
jgi:predicted acetyltransferase